MSSSWCVTIVFMVLWLQAIYISPADGQQVCFRMDLAFVVDGSGSICDDDTSFTYATDTTCSNWLHIVSFIYNLVNSLTIDPAETRVALITFATTSMVQWNLTSYPDKPSLLNAINNLPYNKGGQTDTTGALRLLNSAVFNTAGDRPDVNNTAIIITDGRPTDNSSIVAAINAVHNSGIRTLVIGVTSQVDDGTLKLLSSPPQQINVTYFIATDFQSINFLLSQLETSACSSGVTNATVVAVTLASTTPLSTQSIGSTISFGCDKMDLCFLLDGSGSICDNDPLFDYTRDQTCNNWKLIVTFVHSIVNDLNIGTNNVRVAVGVFASSSQVLWGLSNYTDKQMLLNAIDSIQYNKGGTTDTTGGLNLMNTQIFNSIGDRPDASNTAIIITDGKPTVGATVPAAIQAVQATNTRTLAVGITDSIDQNTLKLLSSSPQQLGITYFMATDYRTIDDVRVNLQAQTCGVASTPPQLQAASCTEDIVFVVDGSGSICDSDSNFVFTRDYTCTNWQYIIGFVHNVTSYLTIGPTATRVALLIFATGVQLQWGLDAYSNKESLLYAIDNLQYQKGGTTNTTGALNVVKDQVFTAQFNRPNVSKVAMIITDGKPTVPSTVPAAINAVHLNNIFTLVVGVTNQVDVPTLAMLSSPPQALGVTYFMASNYNTISEVSLQLLNQTCVGTSTLQSTASTTTPSTTVTTSTMSTTTSPTSTTPIPTTSPITFGTTTPACTDVLDLCFLLDGSGSICDTDPKFVYETDSTCENWSFILQFIQSIVESLTIGYNQIRVGMVVFATDVNVLWNLTAYTSSATLVSAINSIQYHKGGQTNTTGGLNVMRTQIFGTADNRPNANNTVIIITDGKPTDTTTVQAAIDAVHNAGIKTLVVGVTTEADPDTLKQLSSPPQLPNVTYFSATNFDTLPTVKSILTTKTCD